MPRGGRGYQRGLCTRDHPPSPLGKCATERSTFTRPSPPKKTFSSSVLVVVGGSRDPCHTRFPLSFHPTYRHIVRTLFNTPFCEHSFPSSIFVNREKERKEFFLWYFTLEIDFPFDSFVFLDVPLFCLPCFLDRINQRQSMPFYDAAPLLFLHCWAKIKEILLICRNVGKIPLQNQNFINLTKNISIETEYFRKLRFSRTALSKKFFEQTFLLYFQYIYIK